MNSNFNNNSEPCASQRSGSENVDETSTLVLPCWAKPAQVAKPESVLPKIPITIITGFLGSGKTTFLNYVLKQNHGKKIVVIQNEFGERIGLEEAMIVSKGTSKTVEWIEFPNGCLCCTVKEEMLIAIENFVMLAKEIPNITCSEGDNVKQNSNLDAILIETDGLADPEPLVRSLWVDTELESTVYLDAVVCIIDSVFFLQELGFGYNYAAKYKNEAYRQVAFADVILLNKADLAPLTETADSYSPTKDLEMILSKINPLAQRYRTIRGEIPLQSILNINAFDIKHNDYFDKLFDDQSNFHQIHNPETKAITIVADGYVTVAKVNQWLASLLWEQNTMNIYRMKGVINIEGSNEKYNLQAVMQTFDLQPSGVLWELSEKRTNKIVIVGKNLNPENLISQCDIDLSVKSVGSERTKDFPDLTENFCHACV